MSGERQLDRPSDTEVEALARSLISMLTRREADALVGLLQPDYEFHSRLVSVEGRAYKGPDGIREYFRDVDEGFIDPVWELGEVVALSPGKAIVSFRMRATGRGGGIPIDFTTYQVWTFRDQKILRNDVYGSKEEAYRAAGVEERPD